MRVLPHRSITDHTFHNTSWNPMISMLTILWVLGYLYNGTVPTGGNKSVHLTGIYLLMAAFINNTTVITLHSLFKEMCNSNHFSSASTPTAPMWYYIFGGLFHRGILWIINQKWPITSHVIKNDMESVRISPHAVTEKSEFVNLIIN